jgi:hypothetical protein
MVNWEKKLRTTIDYQETFREYHKWLVFPHCEKVTDDMCKWYQDSFRFYEDEVVYKEKFQWYIIHGLLFYVIVMPIIFCILGSVVLFFKIKNRG